MDSHCGTMGLHDVAVHAGRRIVSEVRMETKHIQEKQSATDENARQA